MLYKFKSKATGDLIMLEANGRQVLQAMGKEAAAKGIVLPPDMAAATARLQAAIAQEEADFLATVQAAKAEGRTPPALPEVSLRQRAAPMLEMLRRCALEEQEIVWGV